MVGDCEIEGGIESVLQVLRENRSASPPAPHPRANRGIQRRYWSDFLVRLMSGKNGTVVIEEVTNHYGD